MSRPRTLPDALLSDPRFVAVFESRVVRRGPDDCWLYNGRRGDYGLICIDGLSVAAHRFSLGRHLGHWPRRLACHTCDVPGCVNPAHLFDGTHAQNTADMIAKGRTWSARRRKTLRLNANN